MVAALTAPIVGTVEAATASATSLPNERFAPYDSDGPVRKALRGAIRRLLAFREETPLSETQRAQMRNVLQAHKNEIQTQLAAMQEAHAQLRAAIRKGGANGAEVNAAADRVAAAARSGALLHAKIAGEIRPLLTNEQRQRLDEGIDAFAADLSNLGAGL